MDAELWDVETACKFLNVGRTTLLKLAYRGEIPSVTVGRLRRFPATALRAWIESRVREGRNEGAA